VGETPNSWSTWLMIPRCCRVETLSGDLSRIGGESTKNAKNTKNKRGNHKRKTL
jgi:hypothetical protein